MTWEELNKQIKSGSSVVSTGGGWESLNTQAKSTLSYKTPKEAQQDYYKNIVETVGDNKGKTNLTKSTVSALDVAKELPGQIVKNFGKNITDAGKAIVNTLFPSISEFTKTTTGIMGEGLAYLIDPNVREMYDKGNTDILPYISKTSVSDVAKKTAGASIEAAVWSFIPSTLKMNIIKRFGSGAIQGLGIAIAEGLSKDETPEEIIKNSAQYGVTAGAIEMIAPFIPAVLSAKIKDLPRITGKSLNVLKKEIVKPLEIVSTKEAEKVIPKIKLIEKPKEFFDQSSKQIINNVSEPIDNNVSVLSKKITNSFENEPEAFKPGGIERAKKEILSGEYQPIRVRKMEDGTLYLEDGRHRLEAAKELGIENIKVEDVTSKYAPIEEGITIKPYEGTGQIKTRGAALSLESRAIERNLVKELGDLPEYKTVNFSEQAQKATNLLKEDIERSIRIALGKERAPSDILPEAIFKSVEKKALLEGDVDLIRELGTSSKLFSEETTMGQRIGYLRERNPESSVTAIKEISKARTKALETRVKNISKEKDIIIKKIKEEISKTAPKKQTWSEFIKSLSC